MSKIYLDPNIIDWFDNNYIEDRDECIGLVIDGTINYPFTPYQLIEGCKELRKYERETGAEHSLASHIGIIGKLCNMGISASITGECIRKELIKRHKKK